MPKILVADDNSNIQKMVALAFTKDRGIEIVAVGNGEAAVRRLPDFQPDLILADIFMPVRSGYEVCEFVKKSELFSQTPVILLVGAFDPLDEKEARRVGADGVLKKPFIPPDPLIAMVMSALEKNPRIAAEMAKAKQAKEAPPHPIPQLEMPVRRAPGPLPTFPEPTPDEAALIYGFGSGRRALDDASTEPSSEATEVAAEAEESDAEFDAAATSRDWRRTAMDFEVPEADANRPAFSSDEDMEPLTSSPSENESPADEASATQPETTAPPMIPEQAEALAPAQVESAAEPQAGSHEVPDVPLVPVEQAESYQVESLPEQSAPAAAHWMDTVAPTHLEYPQPQRNWLDALSAQSEETAIVSRAEADPVLAGKVAQKTVESETELPASAIESAAATTEVVAAPDDYGVNTADEALPSWAGSSHPSAQPSSDDSFFAEESEAAATKESWFAPDQAAEQTPEHALATQSEAAPSITGRNDASTESDSLESEPTDANSLALRDPNLVEPEAVRVTPEPLLVHDEADETSQYGSPTLQAESKHSFFAPPVESPVTEDVAAVQTPPHPDTWAQSFQSAPHEIDERVPTMPPPNLEALAEIPFLTPPANLHMDRREHSASNPEMVDEIVRRVLESLEPRLHDLLAQEVLKPLVENILQNEMPKDVTTR